MTETLVGPVRLVPTPVQEDHDSEGFRAVIEADIVPQRVNGVGRLLIDVTARYDGAAPGNWTRRNSRSIVLPLRIGPRLRGTAQVIANAGEEERSARLEALLDELLRERLVRAVGQEEYPGVSAQIEWCRRKIRERIDRESADGVERILTQSSVTPIEVLTQVIEFLKVSANRQ